MVANGPLFFADALFTPDILARHPVPFRHDAAQALKSLDVLGGHEVVAPGRGAPLEGAAVHAAIRAFAGPRLELAEAPGKALSVPRSGEELVGILAQRFDAQNLNLVGFLLARATVCVGAEAFLENGALRRRGMWGSARPARRCLRPSEGLGGFAVEPHAAAVDVRADLIPNPVAQEAKPAREALPELARNPLDRLVAEVRRLRELKPP